MKRIIILCLICTLLLACVPTPEEEVVLNKTEGRLEAAITETTPVPAYQTEEVTLQPNGTEPKAPQGSDPQPTDEPRGTLRSAIAAPETLAEAFSGKAIGDTLTVEIDAAVDVPNVSVVPVFSAVCDLMDAAEKTRIVGDFLGEGPFYKPDYDLAQRLTIENGIELQKQLYKCMDKHPYGARADYAGIKATIQSQIQSFQKALANIPETATLEACTPDPQSNTVALMMDSGRLLILRGPKKDEPSCYIQYADYGTAPDPNPTGYLYREMRTEKEAEAAKIAQAFVDRIGIADTTVLGVARFDETTSMGLNVETGADLDLYTVVLAPTHAGIPIYSYTNYFGSDTGRDAVGVDYYGPVLEQDWIAVSVYRGEAKAMFWQAPTVVTATENENVALLPFDEIMNIFRKHVFMNIYLDKGFPETMHVQQIRLSYMRVKKHNADDYYLLPVWDFMGYCTSEAFPGDTALARLWYFNQSFLTINAIDGSIIDRNKGY